MNTLGQFYGVGIGPGRPDLLTLRAAEIFRSVDVIYTVSGPNTEISISESVVRSLGTLKGHIVPLNFKMSRDMDERLSQIRDNARIIAQDIQQGKNTAFAVLGDAMTYSTFGYILKELRRLLPELKTEVVPGITSFALLAAESSVVLVENNEELRVIPAYRKESAEKLHFPQNSTTILMKTYHSRDNLLKRLSQEEDIEITYGEKLGSNEQFITQNVEDIQSRPETYLSLMLIKKK